ncbi:unnamed protein product [Thelazia callipaeda]|uniref:PDZ domain-containing protein n=1 Tax=Thelazia callipaeda TaxID=103827 RepID=A0A0N5CRF7_THECL|nr:unnamed protein product [Thelazia callipaeda]
MKTNEIKPDEEDSFAEEFAIKWERQVRLESDKSVSGGLAFRLAGSKTHGVFVQYVNQKSKQSEILYKGDRILEVNGVDVRRWTCDQIANILRLVVQNKGYVLLQVIHIFHVGVSRQLHNRKGVIYEITKDANSNLQYCYPSRDLTYSYNSSLPASTSDTTDLSQQKIYEKTGTCTVHYRQKVSSRKSMHFSCYNQNDEQQYSSCHQQK